MPHSKHAVAVRSPDAPGVPIHWLAVIAECVWLCAALTVPVFMDPRANQAFELPKLVLLVGLAGISAALVAVRLVSSRARSVDGMFGLVVLVWALAVTLATLVSDHILESFWGSYDRQSGLLLALTLVGLGAGPWMFLRTAGQLQRLLWASVLGSLPVAVYGLIQRAGLDWIGWIGRPLGITSTLGSSTALGGYLAICATLTAVLVIIARGTPIAATGISVSVRALAIALLGLQCTVIVLTSVRAALVATVVGQLTVYLVLEFHRDRNRTGRVTVITLSAVLLVSAGVIGLSVLRGASAQVDRGTLPRGDTSITERLDLWRSSLRYVQSAAMERPLGLLHGAGPDRQASILEPWLEPSLTSRLPTTRFDRAHFSPIDTMLTSGIVGLAAVIAVFSASVIRARRGFSSAAPSARAIYASIIGGIAVFLVESSVSFPSITSLSMVALLAGASAGMNQVPPNGAQHRSRKAEVCRWSYAALAACLALGAVVILPRLIKHIEADHAHQRSLNRAADEQSMKAIELEREAVLGAPHRAIYAAQLTELLLLRASAAPRETSTRPEVLDATPNAVGLLAESVRVSDIGRQLEPTDPFLALLHVQAISAFIDAGAADRGAWRERTLAVATDAVERAPMRVALRDEAARTALAFGDAETALRFYLDAAAMDPSQAQRRAEIGHVYRATGRLPEARHFYDEAIDLDERSGAAYWGIAQIQSSLGRWPEALDPAQRAARFQMRDWIYRRDLGRVYRELGDIQAARQELRAAARLAPSWHWPALREEIDALGPAD
ncbi:MAG: O-antigen ligase family protein [Chloroflexota bacterium]